VIIWAGNLPDEISWYLRRLNTGWKYVALALVIFHFAVPFALLLSRDLKRNARRLARVAVLLLLMRYVDLLWWIAPNSLPGFERGIWFQWMDIVIPIGMGGIWMAAFVWALRQRPLVPLHDQRFEEVVGHAPATT
jgi:cytochrome bd-type quinol oxidase subunit 2